MPRYGNRFIEVNKILIDGKFVSFTRCGEGSDLLFLHGYGSKKESFYYQIKFFSKYYRVTAPDFPAFGASEAPDAAWSVGDYADWLKKFMDGAGIKRAHVVAHSFGARVALKLFSAQPELCDRLIISGGAGIVKERSPAYIRRVNAYRRVKKLFPKFAEKHFGSKEYRSLSPVQRESYKKIVNEDLRECAKLIKAKTLLIYGERDETTPPFEEGEIFNGLISGSKLEVFKGLGHFCFSESPERFNAETLCFLLSE